MEPLTSAAIAITTLIFTKACEKTGEHLGEGISTQVGKLLQLIQSKSLPQTKAIQQLEQPVNYGEAVLELETSAKNDPELAQAIQTLAVTIQADPKLAPLVASYAQSLQKAPPGTIHNYSKLADEVKNLFQGNAFNAPVTFN